MTSHTPTTTANVDSHPPTTTTTTTTTSKNAYVTLLTRPSYLAGAILLAHTLHKHSPTTPLIITYTPSTLPSTALSALQSEAKHSNIILHAVEHLRLPDDGTTSGMVAERFLDTWTKLRVFDLWTMEQGWETLCWLDADMMIFSNPSPLVFNPDNAAYLVQGDGMRVLATHVCVCNLDRDAWAPADWKRENCAFTHVESSEGVAEVRTVPKTMGEFNSGMFVYRPSKELAGFVKEWFDRLGNEKLRAMRFPDQDFLNVAFEGRWGSLSWRTNALKTWRYWHENIWVDDMVAVLHYIVDKPWAARVGKDGKAGYLGKDGVTHGWWWAEYDRWHDEREGMGERELLDIVAKYVATEDGKENEDMRAIGGGAQDFAKKWVDGKEVDVEEKRESEKDGVKEKEDKTQNRIEETDRAFSKPRLGERGHGPAVRGGKGMRGGGAWSVMES